MLKHFLLSQTQRYTYIVAFILSSGKIILLYSCCEKKGLVYIAIVAPSSRQPFFYFKYISINIHLFYNIYSVSNIKYIYTLFISL